MADYVAKTEDFKAVADAIRTKGGTSAPLAFPTEFASAIQAIPGPKPEQVKEITITKNGDYPITPDVGKVLSKVLAHVAVPTGGGGGGFDPAPFSDVKIVKIKFAQHKAQIMYKDLGVPTDNLLMEILFADNGMSNTLGGENITINCRTGSFGPRKMKATEGKGVSWHICDNQYWSDPRLFATSKAYSENDFRRYSSYYEPGDYYALFLYGPIGG